MALSRPIRGYMVLLVGILLFVGLRISTGAALLESDPNYAHIANEVEPQIFTIALLLSAVAVGWGSLRGILIAVAFTMPPLMLYFTFYPLWVIMIMVLMVPMLAYAALGAWLPRAKAN